MSDTHNDGMSSDDEVPDVELAQYKDQLGKSNIMQSTSRKFI